MSDARMIELAADTVAQLGGRARWPAYRSEFTFSGVRVAVTCPATLLNPDDPDVHYAFLAGGICSVGSVEDMQRAIKAGYEKARWTDPVFTEARSFVVEGELEAALTARLKGLEPGLRALAALRAEQGPLAVDLPRHYVRGTATVPRDEGRTSAVLDRAHGRAVFCMDVEGSKRGHVEATFSVRHGSRHYAVSAIFAPRELASAGPHVLRRWAQKAAAKCRRARELTARYDRARSKLGVEVSADD